MKQWVLRMTFEENITERQYHYLEGICHNLGSSAPALDFDKDEKPTADHFFFGGSKEQLQEIFFAFISRSPGPRNERLKVKDYELYEETGLRNVRHTTEHWYYFADALTECQKGFLLSLADECVHRHIGEAGIECETPSEQVAMFDASQSQLQEIAFQIFARAEEFELNVQSVKGMDSRVPGVELIEKPFAA